MIRFWRKNDGFKWVSYVPTQVLARRKARKERIRQAAEDAKVAALNVAQKSAAGLEHGLAQAGSAAAAGAVHAGHGLERGARGLGQLTAAFGRQMGQGIMIAVRHVASLGPLGLLRVVGWLGGLAVVGAGVHAALHGFDRTGRLTLGLGAAALIVSSLPILWRAFAPTLARLALDVLRTQRLPGAETEAGAWSASRTGTIAVSTALAAAAVGGVGYGASWIYAAVVASAPPVTGTARAVGTQTIRIGDAELRLAGIAAPDADQICGEGGRRWRCGEEARRALVKAVTGKTLTCHARGEDDGGRRLVQCNDGKADIAEALVRGGHAWADRDDTVGYRSAEEAPKATKTGIWRAASVPPWIARERMWADAQGAAPDGCPIKAEVTKGEKIYFMPWSAGYQRLRISKSDLSRGSKSWFCTEQEARAAGYKPAPDRR